jgi:hypothetical protein
MISSPLEPELAERVRALGVVDELFYDELLLPEPRYPNDHGGSPVARDSVATARWNAMLAEANVLYGYPAESSAGLYDALALGPNVRFVQGTSAGMGAHIRRAALGAEVLRRVRFACSPSSSSTGCCRCGKTRDACSASAHSGAGNTS